MCILIAFVRVGCRRYDGGESEAGAYTTSGDALVAACMCVAVLCAFAPTACSIGSGRYNKRHSPRYKGRGPPTGLSAGAAAPGANSVQGGTCTPMMGKVPPTTPMLGNLDNLTVNLTVRSEIASFLCEETI